MVWGLVLRTWVSGTLYSVTTTVEPGRTPDELIFWNERAGSLVIQKKNSLDGSPLAGVQFQLTYADGSYVDYDNGHMSSKGLYETDSSGEIRITGITGTVIAKELKTLFSPSGWCPCRRPAW